MSDRKRKHRRVTMRSYRNTRQMLLVFGVTGMALGAGLAVFFFLQRNMLLMRVGGVYILVSILLLGIRGVLGHLDELNKRRRALHRRSHERVS